MGLDADSGPLHRGVKHPLALDRACPVRPFIVKPKIVILTTSLLTDRMLLYSDCLARLREDADVEVWASSARNSGQRGVWDSSPVHARPFPVVLSFREFPHNFLRRVNERAWDHRLKPPSRLSMNRHVRDSDTSLFTRLSRALGLVAGGLWLHRFLEGFLERVLTRYPRSPESVERFSGSRPDLVVTTAPFWFHEPAVAAHARMLGIPVVAMIPSWDNVTTKNRMVFRYDGYLVWSDQTRSELRAFYDDTRDKPVTVVGAPQFDVFREARFEESREVFCARHNLDPRHPIIVYAIGSPYFIKGEHYGALHLAERIQRGELGQVQMLVRPHPTKDNAELVALFEGFSPSVRVQKVATPGTEVEERSQGESQIRDWISTFRHAAVVVNLASTVTIDASLFDKPVVNVNFDPSPGRPQEALIKEVNSTWSHFRPVAESGAVTMVNDDEELFRAVRTYLASPELHRMERRSIAEFVCGFTDGNCGRRLAQGILEFARTTSPAVKVRPNAP